VLVRQEQIENPNPHQICFLKLNRHPLSDECVRCRCELGDPE